MRQVALRVCGFVNASLLFCGMFLLAGIWFWIVGKYILEPLAPIITILFVVLMTGSTCARWWTAVLSLTGIALYFASWFVWIAYDDAWLAISLFMVGMTLWFAAVYYSCKHIFVPQVSVD